MVRFESWPLAGLQVGALTVVAPGDAEEVRGPVLTVDAKGRCLVDFDRRERRVGRAPHSEEDARVVRLCRMDYDLTAVRWWRRGVEGASDGLRSVVLCLGSPPTLTSGRRITNPGVDKAEKHVWGARGQAEDFTGGAARATPIHMFAFRTPDDVNHAVAAMMRAAPGLRSAEAPAGAPLDGWSPGDVDAFLNRAQLAPRGVAPRDTGKRDRPEGRVLVPPRKRRELGGDDDPGFVG